MWESNPPEAACKAGGNPSYLIPQATCSEAGRAVHHTSFSPFPIAEDCSAEPQEGFEPPIHWFVASCIVRYATEAGGALFILAERPPSRSGYRDSNPDLWFGRPLCCR